MATEDQGEGQGDTSVLFYARALYHYDPVEDSEIGFNENEVVSVIEDCNDGWWRAYTETATGRVPANYFEILPSNEQQEGATTGEEYFVESQDAYDYNNTTDAPQHAPPPANPIADTPEYKEQMKMWGDLLQSQKEEKIKLEKQIAELQGGVVNLRKEAFYFKQFDFLLQEVLKLETEMDLDLDSSIQFQRAQLALSRDLKAVKELVDGVKLENQQKKHLDEKLDDFNNKLNNSLQLLENNDKARKVFYGDLLSLQNFLEDVEKRKKAEEDEKTKQKERDVQGQALRQQMLQEREALHSSNTAEDDDEWA